MLLGGGALMVLWQGLARVVVAVMVVHVRQLVVVHVVVYVEAEGVGFVLPGVASEGARGGRLLAA